MSPDSTPDPVDIDRKRYTQEEHGPVGEKHGKSFTEAGSGAANADAAPEARPTHSDGEEHAPHAKTAEAPLSEHSKHDHLEDKTGGGEHRQEALIDEAVEETFPASDPISPKHIT